MPENDEIRLPPQNIEAEQAVLGAILMDAKALDRGSPFISKGAFYKESHNRIFSAMLELQNVGDPIDAVTLTNHLAKQGMLDKVGGAYYITGLVEALPSAANIEHYAEIVWEKHVLREIIASSHTLIKNVYDGEGDPGQLLDRAESRLSNLQRQGLGRESAGLDCYVKDAMAAFEDSVKNKGKSKGLSTGFWDLDKMTGGFERGELTVLAGRPAQGKTALAIGLACRVLEKGGSVFFASLEMTRRALIQRLAYNLARVDGQKYNYGDFSSGEVKRLKGACDKICSLPLEIDDRGGQPIGDILASARTLKPAMVIIDYLQLLAAPSKGMKLYEKVTENSLACKTMAKNLGVPILLLSQLSRAPEGRKQGRPVMSDLRESGAIEQDADHIWMLYRAETYGIPNMENRAELIIAKNRNGPTGSVDLTFLKQFISFEGYFEEPL